MPVRIVLALVLCLGLVACGEGGSGSGSDEDRSRSSEWPGLSARPADSDVEDIDPFDPAYSLLPDTNAAERKLMRRLGRRSDYKVPREEVIGLPDGALARAVIARMWHEIDPGSHRYGRLNAGQRALFAIQWADAEILNGGFAQLWFNDTGAVAPDLAGAAKRVGAGEHAAIFADAAELFPGGRIPRARRARQHAADGLEEDAILALDERYTATQFHRRTLLAPILARYVREHPGEFFAGR